MIPLHTTSLHVKIVFYDFSAGKQRGGSECSHSCLQYTHAVYLCKCVCVCVRVCVCMGQSFVHLSAGAACQRPHVRVLCLFDVCMCVRQEGNAAGVWDPHKVLLFFGSPVRVSVGMHSLRRRAWLRALSHCPVAPVFQLSCQADR